MRLLYTCSKQNILVENQAESINYKINSIRASFWKVKEFNDEKIELKTFLVRKLFACMSKGNLKIFSAHDLDGNLMHTSYVMPRCYKFPFLKRNEYVIGPCNTLSEFRGQGIYPNILRNIVCSMGTEDTRFYMVVNSNNTSSIRGIEKAGFRRIGTIEVKGITKRYYIKHIENEGINE